MSRLDRRKTYPLNDDNTSDKAIEIDEFVNETIVPKKVGGVIKSPGSGTVPVNITATKISGRTLYRLPFNRFNKGGTSSSFGSRKSLSTSVFLSSWKTDNAGASNNDQIALPLVSTGNYDFIVDWGDGTKDNIKAYNQAEVTHTYLTTGTYDIKIEGVINGWAFNGDGDNTKIISISGWGTLNFGNNVGAFRGCANLISIDSEGSLNLEGVTTLENAFSDCNVLSRVTGEMDTKLVINFDSLYQNCPLLVEVPDLDVSSAIILDSTFLNTGFTTSPRVLNSQNVQTFLNTWSNCSDLEIFAQPDFSGATSLEGCLQSCTSLVSISLQGTENVTNFSSMFIACSNLESISMDTSSGENMFFMFLGCSALTNVSLDLRNMTNGTNMFFGVTLDTQIYSDLLIATEENNQNNTITFSGGNSQYNVAGGVARAALIADHSWTITDGGPE